MQAPAPPPGFVLVNPQQDTPPPGGFKRITPPKAPKVVDPYDAKQDAIKNANEAERIRMAREREAREQEEYERKKALGPQGEATESERKASSFLGRAIQAESDYLNIDANPDQRGRQEIGGRSPEGQWFSDTFPNMSNRFNSPERQLADQAQRAFIAAVLRYDSGAAIPPDEFITNARIYFPQPNDSPEVIAQKAKARETAVEGLRRSAGRAAPQSVTTPEGAADIANFAMGTLSPGPSALPVGVPPTEGLIGSDDREEFDNGALQPGQTFAYDGQGNRIGILNPDGTWNSGFASIVDNASERKADAELERILDGKTIGMSPLLDKGYMLNLSDELAGVAGGARELLTGGDPIEGYRSQRDLERAAQKAARKEYGIVPELAAGFLAPVGVLGQAKNFGQFVRQGAAIGAAAGFGEGEGARSSLGRTVVGGGIGGGFGAGASQLPKVANAAMNTRAGQRVSEAIASRRVRVNPEVVAAGERQGIPIRLADFVPSKSQEFGALESNANFGNRVQEQLNADIGVFADRVAGLGAGARSSKNLARGDTIQKAGQRYIARTRAQANDLYNRARQSGGDETVDATPFIQDVDNRIASLKANGEEANSGIISMLEGMKRDLASGISVGKLQAQRTTLRSRLDRAGLTMDPNQAQLNGALSAASETLKSGLSNPAARSALSEADAFYADRQGFINGVVKYFSDRKGGVGPETAAKRFDAFLKEGGNFRVAQKMFGQLDDAEKGMIRATVAESLGRNAQGEFSLPIFLNNTSGQNSALSDRAKFMIFGRDGVRALRDLQTIAKAKVEAGSNINRSRTAAVSERNIGRSLKDSLLGALGLGGGAAIGDGNSLAALGAGAAAMAAGRGAGWLNDRRKMNLLMNPKFTTWLRNMPDSNDPAIIERYADRLGKLASREQQFLMDARAIQDFVSQQVSKSPGRAAAEDKASDRRGVEPR